MASALYPSVLQRSWTNQAYCYCGGQLFKDDNLALSLLGLIPGITMNFTVHIICTLFH